MEELIPNMASFASLLASVKERIRTAQVRAAVAGNPELVLLH